MNEITLNIQSFSKIIRENFLNKEAIIPQFKLIFQKYEQSLGGCNCNKVNRINMANGFYSLTLSNLDKNDFLNLKKLLNVEKIKFEDNQNKIFLEV